MKRQDSIFKHQEYQLNDWGQQGINHIPLVKLMQYALYHTFQHAEKMDKESLSDSKCYFMQQINNKHCK